MAWDFTIEYAYLCETNYAWSTQVKSSSGGGTYTVSWERLYGRAADEQGCMFGWSCTCKGFQYRRTCSHVTKVAASQARCGWNAEMDTGAEAATDPATGEKCCPECGAPVQVEKVAV
jgi:hypothetical protein